jgi:hypothetical protein
VSVFEKSQLICAFGEKIDENGNNSTANLQISFDF